MQQQSSPRHDVGFVRAHEIEKAKRDKLTILCGILGRREAPVAGGSRALEDRYLVRREGHCSVCVQLVGRPAQLSFVSASLSGAVGSGAPNCRCGKTARGK